MSSALSKNADYGIASAVVSSLPGAAGEISADTLKNKSPIGDGHSTKYISDHPEEYGRMVFGMAYNSSGEIGYFQCVYDGYFVNWNESGITAEKVSDSTRFNNWPQTRAPGTDGW